MRLGPDGKIYVPASYGNDDIAGSANYTHYSYGLSEDPNNYPTAPNYPFNAYLGVVENPNDPSGVLSFNRLAVPLKPYSSAAGVLGGGFTKPNPVDTTLLTTDVYLCKENDSQTLTPANPTASSYFEWDNGSSTLERVVDTQGTYWVRSGNYCHFQIDTFIVYQEILNPTISVNGFVLGTTRPYSRYQWLFEGSPMPGETGPELTVTQNGSYQVVVSNGGCIDTSEVYSVNNVGVSHAQPLATFVRVYPNPTSGELKVISPIDVNLRLTSIDGKTLKSANRTKTLSLQDVVPGMYILQITDKAGQTLKLEKVIKTAP